MLFVGVVFALVSVVYVLVDVCDGCGVCSALWRARLAFALVIVVAVVLVVFWFGLVALWWW